MSLARRIRSSSVVFLFSGALLVLGSSACPAQNYVQRASQLRAQTQAPPAYPESPRNARQNPSAMTQGSMAGTLYGAAGNPGVTGLYPTKPRPFAASATLTGMRQALNMFYLDTGRYPTPAEGLSALLRAPAGVRNWRGPYVSLPSDRPPFTDPWGNPYVFIDTSRGNVRSYTIRSNGPDGIANTADDLKISG